MVYMLVTSSMEFLILNALYMTVCISNGVSVGFPAFLLLLFLNYTN